MSVETLLGMIFGVGGVGALTVIVTSYRRLKTGKLNDEESIIKRLHRELGRAEARAETAEEAHTVEVVAKAKWREQAYQYRLQLISDKTIPRDDPELWAAAPFTTGEDPHS